MDSDVKSRLVAETGPYDDVVAVAEGIINKNFATIFAAVDEMKHVTYENEDQGFVDITIQAPYIRMAATENTQYSMWVDYMIP